MGAISNVQSNFLGGLWSKFAQGRLDHPRYKTALAECLNGLVVEEGAWTRRPGFRFCAFTRGGAAGRIIPYTFTDTTPYDLELTDGHLRIFSGYSLIADTAKFFTVTAISSATPAVVTTSATNTVATGDTVQFDWYDALTAALNNPDICAVLKNRQFTATRLSTTTFSIADSVTGSSIVGTTVNFDAVTVPTKVAVLIDLATGYTSGSWVQTNIARNEDNALLLHPNLAPQQVTITPDTSKAQVPATASITTANIKDGPYLGIIGNGAILHPTLADATKPNIVQLYVNFAAYDSKKPYNVGDLVQNADGAFQSIVDNNIGHNPVASTTYWTAVDAGIVNGPDGFTSGDIGRMVRLYSVPPLYDAAETYSKGTAVTLRNDVDDTYGFYISAADTNLGNAPDGETGLSFWLPTTGTDIARWTWGKITAVGTGTDPRMTVNIYGDPLLYFSNDDNDTYIYSWRLGVYGSGEGNGWPTCGVFHEGRLWLSGAVPNRFDASNSNDFLNFAPTSADGTVADNHSISATLNATDVNPVLWMESTDSGLLAGTKGGEWRLMASNLDDPLTPTSTRARRVTKYGCADVPPVKAGFALLFVQKTARAVYEMLAEVFTGRVVAQNLSSLTKNLGKNSFKEITYQREQVPVIWARDNVGALFGCTYRRVSPSGNDEPSFYAWHRHTHGSSRTFKSIGVGPSDVSAVDMLSTVTLGADGKYAVEFMTPLFDEDATYTRAWFMDFATGSSGAIVTTVGGNLGLQIYGLWPHNGTSPTFFLGGINCGSFAVAAGTAFVPFATYDGVAVNLAYIQQVNTAYDAGTIDFGNAGTVATYSGTHYDFSIVVGWPYTSRGQRLRPATADETGAQIGPGFAKLRRNHLVGVHLHNTVNGKLKIGTDFTTMRGLPMTTKGGTAYTSQQLFSGVIQTSIDDTYSYDGQIAWQTTEPYPATVLAVGGFLQTQDQ